MYNLLTFIMMTNVWQHYLKRKETIHKKYPDICNQCESVIENLWLILGGLNKKFLTISKELSIEKQFILSFIFRNICYIISAYKLTEEGLVNPARNIIRTIYEQILRSILFLKYPEEAKLWNNYWITKTPALLDEIKKKKYWSFNYMVDKLYSGDRKKAHQDFYEEISRYAHPHVRAALTDIYKIEGIEDTSRGILGFSFTNIDIILQTFPELIDDTLNELCEETKEMIGSPLGEIIQFKPNNRD